MRPRLATGLPNHDGAQLTPSRFRIQLSVISYSGFIATFGARLARRPVECKRCAARRARKEFKRLELESFVLSGTADWGAWTEARVARAIEDPETNVVVVGEPRAIVAFGIMSYPDENAHLLLLAVRHANQRQGIGSAILQWLETVAGTAGAKRIVVEARRENVVARSFYCEHGYHERLISKGLYYRIEDGIRIEKWLRSGADA